MIRTTLTRLRDESSDYAINLNLANSMLSQLPNSTIPNGSGTSSVTVSFGAIEAYYVVPLTFVATMHSPTAFGGDGCAAGSYCCLTTTGIPKYYVIEPNSTTPRYDLFQTGTPVFYSGFPIYFSTSTSNWTIYIDQDTDFESLPSASRKRCTSSETGSCSTFGPKWNPSKHFLKSAMALSTEFAFAVQSMILATSNANTDLTVRSGEYVAVDPNLVVPPFIVPSSAMSDAAVRVPGMTQKTFAIYMQGKCSISDALSLVQSTSSPNDIFKPFWSYQVLSSADWLQSISKSAINPQDANPQLRVPAPSALRFTTDVLVNASSYTLVAIQAHPTLSYASSYILTSNNSDIATSARNLASESLNFYVDLKNEGSFSGHSKLLPWRCCYSPVDSANALISSKAPSCSSWIANFPIGSTIDSQQTKRFVFPVGSVPYGYAGYCSFNLSSSGVNFISTVDVGFSIPAKASSNSSSSSTPSASTSGATATPTLDSTLAIDQGASTSCPSPFEPTSGFPFCRPLCTLDQTLLSGGSCVPVDCSTKYLGTRDEYDTAQGVCKMSSSISITPPSSSPTSASTPDSSTSPVADPNASEPAPTPGETISSAFILQADGNYTLDCGPHGTFLDSKKKCKCDEGWDTNPDQYITTAAFCNLEVPKSTAKRVSIPPVRDQHDILIAMTVLLTMATLLVQGTVLFLYITRTSEPDPPGPLGADDVTTPGPDLAPTASTAIDGLANGAGFYTS